MHLKTPASVFLRSTLRKQETPRSRIMIITKFSISLSPERERKRERAPSSSLDIFVSFISYSDVVCSMEYYSQRYSRNVTIRYLLYTITCVLCVRRADLADSRKLGEYDDVLVVHVRDEIHLNEPRGNHFRAFHKASASSLYNSTSY